MKKILSIIFVLAMLLSFAACEKGKDSSPTTTKPPAFDETVKLDTEELKDTWEQGMLAFPNGKTAKIPCTVSEFLEQSGLIIGNEKLIQGKILAPAEVVVLNIAGEGLSFQISAKNYGEEEISYRDAMVVKYNFNNANTANREIRFANTLTPGVTRDAVEKALGIPEGQTSEDTMYYYKGRDEKNKRNELIISFNSIDIVNSVSYEVKY